MLEKFLQHNNLHDADDMDSLLELADLVRELVAENRHADINRVICYTVESGYYEAFSWVLGIIQESLEDAESTLESFECALGKSIPDYDELINRLQVDFTVLRNSNELVCDRNGEVESFFNVIAYETCCKNIYLISSENFDTKDNDYVQYRLIFKKG